MYVTPFREISYLKVNLEQMADFDTIPLIGAFMPSAIYGKYWLNLVPKVLLGTKVTWWIVVTWFRFIAQILGNKTVYYVLFDVPGLKLTPFN